jgi:hypothetical protein
MNIGRREEGKEQYENRRRGGRREEYSIRYNSISII